MPKLTWVGKEKVESHHHDVPYRVLKKMYSFGNYTNNTLLTKLINLNV